MLKCTDENSYNEAKEDLDVIVKELQTFIPSDEQSSSFKIHELLFAN